MTPDYEMALIEASRMQREAWNRLPFLDRALKAIDGKEPMTQLELLREYVEQAERDTLDGFGPPEDHVNILRRRYIRLASELYRERLGT